MPTKATRIVSIEDARKLVARKRSVRVSNKHDPALAAHRKAIKPRLRAVERAAKRIEAAGFNEASHYHPGGVPSYCACGSVADHNAAFDKLVEGAR